MGVISLYFTDSQPIVRWLDGGADMPDEVRLQYFGDGERPVRKPSFLISDGNRYREHLRRREHGVTLFGDGFFVCASPGPVRPRIELYPIEQGCREVTKRARERRLLAHAERVLRHFVNRGLLYGRAGCWDEWRARNLFEFYVAWSTQPCTTPVGRDIHKYLPGLYWVNYLSREFKAQHQLDLDSIARELDVPLFDWLGGYFLRLYDTPDQWESHRDQVTAVIERHPGIFAISRIERPPPDLGPRAEQEYSSRVLSKWW